MGDQSVALVLQELQSELLARLEKEQSLRTQLVAGAADDVADQIVLIDRENCAWLGRVLDEYGWPGRSLVGEQGANAAFLFAQHAPDLEFQARCLQLVEKAAALGEATMVHVAYLTDRVRMRRGQPQLFGTQGAPQPRGSTGPIEPWPIEDPDLVDERRSAIGLSDLATYFAHMNEFYAPTDRAPS